MIERLLRWTGVLIAVLAWLDPSVTMAGRTRAMLGLVVQRGPSMALPAGNGSATREQIADRVRATLRDRLRGDFEIVDVPDPRADRAVNAAAFIVIGDRYPDDPFPDGTPASTVTVSAPLGPNTRIAGVHAPRAVPPSTAVRLDVIVEGTDVAGGTTDLVVRSRGVELARAKHAWTGAHEIWRTALDVVPLGQPPFAFEIAVEGTTGERAAADNRATILVDQSPRLRVLVIEARPSWAAAFVRRSLEGDPRFEVAGVSRVSPGATVSSGRSGEPSTPELDGVSASEGEFDAVLVGGLERLSAADVSRLDRFMQARGGPVVLLPDAALPAGQIHEILQGVALRETLLERPSPLEMTSDSHLPRIDASELLEATELPAGATVMARAQSSRRPVIWSVPRGSGRLFFSGAMDAWRARAETGVEFERLWRSVVSGLALAARPPVDVSVVPQRAVAGQRVRVTAQVRRSELERWNERLSVSARAGQNDPIRLWPDPRPGVFTGSFLVEPAADESRLVTVTIGGGATGTARLTIDRSPRDEGGLALSQLAETHRGINVGPHDLARLERHLRAEIPSPPAPSTRHPMRSAWWIVPFAASLSSEWWLRRRAGRR